MHIMYILHTFLAKGEWLMGWGQPHLLCWLKGRVVDGKGRAVMATPPSAHAGSPAHGGSPAHLNPAYYIHR